MSKLVQSLCSLFNVKRHHTSAYHPQTNASCERRNSTLLQGLRAYINKEQTNWPDLLPGISMAYRATPSNATSFSPYYLLYGREMRTPIEVTISPEQHQPGNLGDLNSYIQNVQNALEKANEIAKQTKIKQQEQNKKHYDKKAAIPNFEVEQRVWLQTYRKQKGKSPKLSSKKEGPYYIADALPNYLYKLRLCSNDAPLKGLVHANRLQLYHDPSDRAIQSTENNDTPCREHEDLPRPPNVNNQVSNQPKQNQTDKSNNKTQISDTNNDSETTDEIDKTVEEIICSKYSGGKKWYKVKFSDNTRGWVLLSSVPDKMRRKFHSAKTMEGRIKKKEKIKKQLLRKTRNQNNSH